MLTTQQNEKDVWLVYDGECPICRPSANALKIRAAVGRLHLVNARGSHPLLEELKTAGLNIDNGMVIKFNDNLYHGAEAQHILALIGTNNDWFNRLNVILFRSKFLAKLFYPVLKSARNILLWATGVNKINNLHSSGKTPLFQKILNSSWHDLSFILKKRYTNRPYSNDVVAVKGILDIEYSKLFIFALPFLKLFKILIPYKGKNIPTSVEYCSKENKNTLTFKRQILLPKKSYSFNSYMLPSKDNYIIEMIRFNFGCRMQCSLDNKKIIFKHQRYVFKLFGMFIPLPIAFLIGKAYAEEEGLSDDLFRMRMEINHPVFGKLYSYQGIFSITHIKQ